MGEPAEVFTHVIYENEETKRRTVVGTGAKPSKYEVASSQGDKGDTISKSHTDETALWRLKVLSIVLMIMVIISTVTFSALIYTLMKRADVTEQKSDGLRADLNLLKSKSGTQTDDGRSRSQASVESTSSTSQASVESTSKASINEFSTRMTTPESNLTGLNLSRTDVSEGWSSRSLFIRWGRTECSGNETQLVYKGYTAGRHSTQGGGSSILCLPEEPTWGRFDDTSNLYRGYIWGAEIDIDEQSEGKVFEQNMDGQDQPCAVCMVPRSLTHMFPGRATCFPGWTMEYAGYLMTSYRDRAYNIEYFCLDSDPEGVYKGWANDNQNMIYLVEAKCGSLPCPPYVEGREVACAVCSK